MSLLTALRAGVKVAHKVTKPLQATVSYARCAGLDGYGPVYAAAVSLLAVVDEKQQQVRTASGVVAASRCQLTFLDAAAVAAASGGGITERDRITLPDGTGGAILAVGGFIDAGTGFPVATEVWLG